MGSDVMLLFVGCAASVLAFNDMYVVDGYQIQLFDEDDPERPKRQTSFLKFFSNAASRRAVLRPDDHKVLRLTRLSPPDSRSCGVHA